MLVVSVIGGQAGLDVGRHDLPVVDDRGGVLQPGSAGARARTDIPDDHSDIRDALDQAIQQVQVVVDKPVLKQEVPRRAPGDGHLRENAELGAPALGEMDRLLDETPVARKIPDGGVDLSERHFH